MRLDRDYPSETGDSALTLWVSLPILEVFFASLWVARLTPECLSCRELVSKGLCIAWNLD